MNQHFSKFESHLSFIQKIFPISLKRIFEKKIQFCIDCAEKKNMRTVKIIHKNTFEFREIGKKSI